MGGLAWEMINIPITFVLSRLVGTIFKLLAQEKLGYDISLVKGQEDPTSSNSDLGFSFQKLSSCGNEL